MFVPRAASIGYDPDEDRRRHTVTERGVVVVTKDDEPFIREVDDGRFGSRTKPTGRARFEG